MGVTLRTKYLLVSVISTDESDPTQQHTKNESQFLVDQHTVITIFIFIVFLVSFYAPKFIIVIVISSLFSNVTNHSVKH